MEHHENGKSGKQFYRIVISILVLLLIIAGIVIAVLLNKNPQQLSVEENDPSIESTEVEKLTDSIAIPGFSQLTLAAGKCEQAVALSNPAENFCYFKISLILEDGTVIWVSDLVEPGKQSEPITLLQALEAGTYENVTVHYDCFTMDKDLTQLNSGEIKITLNVQ